jgi:hypothetical protein
MKIDEEYLKKAPYLDIESADASGLLWSDVKALREKLGMGPQTFARLIGLSADAVIANEGSGKPIDGSLAVLVLLLTDDPSLARRLFLVSPKNGYEIEGPYSFFEKKKGDRIASAKQKPISKSTDWDWDPSKEENTVDMAPLPPKVAEAVSKASEAWRRSDLEKEIFALRRYRQTSKNDDAFAIEWLEKLVYSFLLSGIDSKAIAKKRISTMTAHDADRIRRLNGSCGVRTIADDIAAEVESGFREGLSCRECAAIASKAIDDANSSAQPTAGSPITERGKSLLSFIRSEAKQNPSLHHGSATMPIDVARKTFGDAGCVCDGKFQRIRFDVTEIAPAVSDVNRCRSAGFFLRYEKGPLINGSSSISFKWYPNGQGMEEKKKKSDETAKVLAKSLGGKENG